MRVVAVEDGLSNVRAALEEAGFKVVGLSPEELGGAQAVVVGGGDVNLLQMQDIKTRVPVISAEARSADEIVEDVREKIGMTQG